VEIGFHETAWDAHGNQDLRREANARAERIQQWIRRTGWSIEAKPMSSLPQQDIDAYRSLNDDFQKAADMYLKTVPPDEQLTIRQSLRAIHYKAKLRG
jgi:hypothetical protein